MTSSRSGVAPDREVLGPFPQVQQLRAAHEARDWPAIRAGIEAFSSADDRYLAIDTVSCVGDEEFYQSVVAAAPGDALAHALLGQTLLETGWGIRGDGRASQVSAEQFRQFHAYLRRAEAALIESTAIRPERAETWAVRLTVARGLQLDQAEAQRRYARAARHEPHCLSAQRSLLQKLLPKWGGSWEHADAFARECAGQAPDGAPNVLLIADLHLEHLIDLPRLQQGAYLKSPQVRAELLHAARRGPLNSGFRPGLYWKTTYNHFALMLSLVEDSSGAAYCFRVLDGHVGEFPWAFWGDPVKQFAHHRDRALARG